MKQLISVYKILYYQTVSPKLPQKLHLIIAPWPQLK